MKPSVEYAGSTLSGWRLHPRSPCKWLNTGGVAEISHCGTCNFSAGYEFK